MAETSGGGEGFPSLRLKIGSVPFSHDASRVLIDALRSGLRLKGVDIPAPDDLVRQFVVQDNRLTITVNLPDQIGGLDRILGTATNLNPTLVVEAYCRLADPQRRKPEKDLAMQVRRAFPIENVAKATPEANSAAFMVLAMMIADKRVGSLAACSHVAARTAPRDNIFAAVIKGAGGQFAMDKHELPSKGGKIVVTSEFHRSSNALARWGNRRTMAAAMLA